MLTLEKIQALKKGDVLTSQELERHIGLPYNHPHYVWGILELRRFIRAIKEAQEEPVVLKEESRDLLVLTDPQAATYTYRRARSLLKQLKDTYKQQLSVDVTRLNHQQRTQHERQVLIMSQYIQAIDEVTERIDLGCYKTAKLPGKVEDTERWEVI